MLLIFGLGYTASHYAAMTTSWSRILGTVRSAARVAERRLKGQEAAVFDGITADPTLMTAVAMSEGILVSVQPAGLKDPVFQVFGAMIAAAPRLRTIVYLSTVGVYGDHSGAWIDEATIPVPESERGRARLAVEQAWRDLGVRSGKTVHILRLAGIYGPGRNALADLAAGEARRIDKPGQVFNRIHVTDIGRTIDAAFASSAEGAVWNVADDEPAPAPDVVLYAARLMGIEPPSVIPFEIATLSPMARSFYAANRRISDRAIKETLGVRLAYPTFRDGLDALWAAGEGKAAG